MNYFYKKYTPYLFLLPTFVLLSVFFFIPFFQTIGLSFQDYSSNIYEPNWVMFENYVKILKNPDFYKILLNTFLYLICAVPVLAIFPLFLAVLLNQKNETEKFIFTIPF